MSTRPHRRRHGPRGWYARLGEAVEIIARATASPQPSGYTITALCYGRQSGRPLGTWAEHIPREQPVAVMFREVAVPGVLRAGRGVVGLAELGQVCLLNDLPDGQMAGCPPTVTSDPLGHIRTAIAETTDLAAQHRAAQDGRGLPWAGDQLHACYAVLDSFYPGTLIRCTTPPPPSAVGFRLWAGVVRELRRDGLIRHQRLIARGQTDVVFAELATLAHRLARAPRASTVER